VETVINAGDSGVLGVGDSSRGGGCWDHLSLDCMNRAVVEYPADNGGFVSLFLSIVVFVLITCIRSYYIVLGSSMKLPKRIQSNLSLTLCFSM